MKAIIIFTNATSIEMHLNYLTTFSLDDDNPVKELPVSSCKRIWMVFDEVENCRCILSKLTGAVEEIYILHHKLPNDVVLTEIANFAQQQEIKFYKRKSQHDDKNAGLSNPVYHLLPEIDLHQNDSAAFEKIFDELAGKLGGDKTLDDKFEFLHQCIFPKTIPESAPVWMKDYGVAVSKFEVLKNLNSESPFDDSYLNTLRELRDALLGEH